MTVQPQTPYKEYDANGVTTSFALEFDCENKDHLIVTIDGVEPPSEAWSLDPVAKNVIFTTAPDAGKKITLKRNTPYSRTTNYQSYDNSFRPGPVNKDFDRVWLKIQELGVGDWLLDLKLQKFRDDVNLTALEDTLGQAEDLRNQTASLKAETVTLKEETESNVEQSRDLLASATLQANAAANSADAASTAKTQAESAANTATTQANSLKTYVDTSLTALHIANKYYPTLATANADIANIAVNEAVWIGDEATGGLYEKKTADATSLTKSAYDPLQQGKAYTDTRLDFVSNLPDTNKFIRELYITGWNGTDEIFLQYFTNNDGGLVSFTFVDKTNNRDVIFTYKKALGLAIYPLETLGNAAGSGFGGYIVVDWNYYTAQVSSGGQYLYPVTRRALSLVNCPYIKEYLDTGTINTNVSTNTNDITTLKQVGIYRNTLASTANHARATLINQFIPNIKLLDGAQAGFGYFIDGIILLTGGIRLLMKRYDLSNPTTTTWVAYNVDLFQGANLVDSYEFKYNTYRWFVTIDWNYYSQIGTSITGGSYTATVLNYQRLFEKDQAYLLNSQPAFYKVGNAFKDGQSKLGTIFAGATFSATGDTAYTYSATQVSNGTRVVLANTNANVNRRFNFAFSPFYVRIPDTYFVYVKYTINSVSGSNNTFALNLSKGGKTIQTGSFFDNIRAGGTYEEVRKVTGDPTGVIATDGTMNIEFWSSANSAAGTVLDITIHDIRVLYNYAQDPVFLNKERKEIEALVRALGYFESEVTIPKFVDNALSVQTINKSLEMNAIGDSTSMMVMWQERLAQTKGWHFNRTMATNGLNGNYALALGGSWCEPIISNFGATGNAGQNHYTRSTAIPNYNLDVLFVLSSFNGQKPGLAWQAGGQLVKADHGINDEAYHGAEVDLITNPTASFPSFGASYYGMLENIMTANPKLRIVLLTLYRFNMTANELQNLQAKNAVIRKAADMYNLQLIDLEKISGINSFTANTLCFDGYVHINQLGGDRLAQVISGLS